MPTHDFDWSLPVLGAERTILLQTNWNVQRGICTLFPCSLYHIVSARTKLLSSNMIPLLI